MSTLKIVCFFNAMKGGDSVRIGTVNTVYT